MTYDDFAALIKSSATPILLLEGTRALPDEKVSHLEKFAEKLARDFPTAIFRSGNALGSDAAWARGVAQVDAARLELVVPYASHRRAQRPGGARVLALEDAPHHDEIVRETLAASPGYESLSKRNDAASKAKFSYLLRDTLKILGAPQFGFTPVTIGIFFADDLQKGGTAHTMRVCRLQNVPALTQDVWSDWPL